MASKKLNSSSDGKEADQIEDMNEKELKNLLDEAITFRNPRDANDKSDTFKRLLQNVTDEDERKKMFEKDSLAHYWRQSNSLQNLIDESHYHLQAHQSHTSSKKQQRRKNSSSVSTRRVEGGSLPVDMHHSSAIQSPPDQPFISELKNNKKRKEKQLQQQLQHQTKDTVIDMAENETDDRKSYPKDTPLSSSYHDAIEMKTFSSRNTADHLQMAIDHVGGDSKFTTANTSPNTITSMASMSSSIPSTMTCNSSMGTSVDSAIPYTLLGGDRKYEKSQSYHNAQKIETFNYPGSTINHSNNILLTGGPTPNYGATSSGGKLSDQVLPLPTGAAISSVMDSKSPSFYNAKRQTSREDMVHHGSLLQATPQMSLNASAPSSIVSSNSKDIKAAKKRTKNDHEKNEKVIKVETMEGFCGNDQIENLLVYIEGEKNSNNQKNHPKNGLVASNNNAVLLNSEEKKKKMVAKNKEKVNKLKKSNSMDELCSTGRQQEHQKSSSSASANNKIAQDTTAVTLRSKSSNLTSGGGTKKTAGEKGAKVQAQQQPKRNERRSWGTEGLWPESNEITLSNNNSNNNNEEEQQENETSSSDSSIGGVAGVVRTNISESSVNISHLESIGASANEAEKFQLVSKKRKVKRKSKEAPELKSSATNAMNNLYSMRGRVGGTKSTHDSNRNNNNNNNSNVNADKHIKKPMMSYDAKQTVAGSGAGAAGAVTTATTKAGKNRRKSTSSMPPSEEGDDGEYSDGGDSVQSLPIETTKTTSSLLSAPISAAAAATDTPSLPTPPQPTSTLPSAENKNVASSKKNSIIHQQFQPSSQQAVQQQLQKPTKSSYADIAKTSTSNRHNNLGNNIIAAASTDKWPSISSSSSHQNNNNINNSTDPFAISTFDAMSNNNNSSSSSSSSAKQQQPKVTGVATTSTNSISTSTISFPELVESNNSRNKQLSNSLDMTAVAAATTVNGDATQTELKSLSFNGGMIFMDSNNNGSETDRINNNNSQKISYSQSLLESHNQQQQQQQQQAALDANGNAQQVNNTAVINTNTSMPSVKNVLTKSKSVDHNNLSSIEHYPALEKTKQTLSDVLSKPIEILPGQKKTKQVKNAMTTATPIALTFVDDGKIMATKKKASKKHVSTSTSPQSSQDTHNQHLHQQQQINSHHRPAVIILDDNNSYDTTTSELGITFGFDINEHLLCGHPNGEVACDISPPVVVMADDIESSASNNANKNTCDIMNTNNLSRNNLSNNYQSIEMYENYMPNATVTGAVLVPHTVIFQQPQSSPEAVSCGVNNIMDSSNDLGYLSSSLHSPPTVVTGTVIVQKLSSPPNQHVQNDQNQPHERDFGLQVTPMEISQQTKTRLEEFKMISLPDFISPPESKNFNYDELVIFVKEEWTKAKRNGIFFFGDQ